MHIRAKRHDMAALVGSLLNPPAGLSPAVLILEENNFELANNRVALQSYPTWIKLFDGKAVDPDSVEQWKRHAGFSPSSSRVKRKPTLQNSQFIVMAPFSTM
ncbi:hypothetical protein AA0229_0187 [Gluconobacter cerinus NRIC 0229]|nr:hypothetical protein AA0229_0187 [Gluconobacter cerinus NRIC 0229]